MIGLRILVEIVEKGRSPSKSCISDVESLRLPALLSERRCQLCSSGINGSILYMYSRSEMHMYSHQLFSLCAYFH